VPEALSLGVKWAGREAAYLDLVQRSKNDWGLYFHYPNTPSWGGAQLKHRDNFTVYSKL